MIEFEKASELIFENISQLGTGERLIEEAESVPEPLEKGGDLPGPEADNG